MIPMIQLIEDKSGQFYTPTSSGYRDYSIWKEVFDIAIELESTHPDWYLYEIKRLRDLKNTYGYAIDERKRKSKIAGRLSTRVGIAKQMKMEGESIERIIQFT